MKVLHVTDADLPARRFNGYDLMDDLVSRGVEGKQVVLRKTSSNPDVVGLFSGRGDELLQSRLREVEYKHSINNLLIPWGRLVAATEAFRNADLVHYHLIHNQVVSLYELSWLFGLRPSVWTFHDPWPLTGHCVHPAGCDGWLAGCKPCPFLNRYFPLARDHADRNWKSKQRLFSTIDIDVVVASDWMLDMVRRSPITAHLEHVSLIPFGVDTDWVLPEDQRGNSRRRLGIADDDFVVLFRASPWEVKGLSQIIEALALGPPARRTTLLTVDGRGMLKALRKDFRIVELGWVDDPARYSAAFSACDVFVMPSLAEAFGLMAVEAMAAGKPVVCFEGTALPAVTHAPDCGIAVPTGDVRALRAAVDRLAKDPAEGQRRGRLGKMIVTEEYGLERYLDAMANLYRSVLTRPRAGDDRHPDAGPMPSTSRAGRLDDPRIERHDLTNDIRRSI
jgi:glycosyltransferase involved in cell wall biosynthesis